MAKLPPDPSLLLPSDTLPGSQERMQLMTLRAAAGLPVLLPGDLIQEEGRFVRHIQARNSLVVTGPTVEYERDVDVPCEYDGRIKTKRGQIVWTEADWEGPLDKLCRRIEGKEAAKDVWGEWKQEQDARKKSKVNEPLAMPKAKEGAKVERVSGKFDPEEAAPLTCELSAKQVMPLADLLKEARRKAKKSMRQVEREAGVSQTYLSHLEHGERKRPSLPVLIALAKCYGVSLDYFSN
jgi:DNA-binding XRE family transcriptional regulator